MPGQEQKVVNIGVTHDQVRYCTPKLPAIMNRPISCWVARAGGNHAKGVKGLGSCGIVAFIATGEIGLLFKQH